MSAPFTLPALPYEKNALEPVISAETIDYHYGKHHQTYLTNLNKAIVDGDGKAFAGKTLEEIIRASTGAIFNNAAQVWNHTFYWNGLTSQKNAAAHAKPTTEKLVAAINQKFGSFDAFKEEFTKKALANFGSGWTWLVKQESDGQLAIVNTSNAETPLTTNAVPLLTADVWEHAYYIDYRNQRAKHIEAFWTIVNWQFVENNYDGAASNLSFS